MKAYSLRLRLLTAWAVFIALTLQVAYVGLRVLFERSITRRTEAELSADLRQLQRGLEVLEDGTVRIARAPTDPQFDLSFGGRYWQITENGITILRSPSLEDAKLELPKEFKPETVNRQTWVAGPEKQHLYAVVRALDLPARDGETAPRTLVVTTAVDAVEIREDTSKFSSDLLASLGSLALLLMAGAFIHVTIGLQPLQRLQAGVAQIREGRTRRVEGQFPDEVMPLITETNELLAAQEDQMVLARQRAADLAHGLKTPLAVMAAKSRLVRRAGQGAVADDIDKQIDAMSRHVERELARSRARGGVRTGLPRIDAAALLREVVSAIQALPREPVIDWTITIPERIEVMADADDVMNISGNLLENAIKWANSRVDVSITHTRTGVRLEVCDDGPGIPPDQVDRVLMRGVRADTTVPGSGLGLAIVSDIVETYDGKLTLTASRLGGLSAAVELPDRAAET